MAKRASKKSVKQPKRKKSTRSKRLKIDRLVKDENPQLPLVWVDRMELTIRGDVPIATLRFYSVVGGRLSEECRIQTTTDHLHRIADVIKGTRELPSKRTGSSRRAQGD